MPERIPARSPAASAGLRFSSCSPAETLLLFHVLTPPHSPGCRGTCASASQPRTSPRGPRGCQGRLARNPAAGAPRRPYLAAGMGATEAVGVGGAYPWSGRQQGAEAGRKASVQPQGRGQGRRVRQEGACPAGHGTQCMGGSLHLAVEAQRPTALDGRRACSAGKHGSRCCINR